MWQPVVETFVLGAGLGLLSVASIVGPQSTVGWGQRGVVTGTVMFCRYLGQSLGAAIFGAIFNAALSGKLHAASAPLRHRLPDQVSGVSAALARPHAPGSARSRRPTTTCGPRSPPPPATSTPRSPSWPR